MEAVDVRGRFVWHQLMTRDVPGAKKFYSKLDRLEDACRGRSIRPTPCVTRTSGRWQASWKFPPTCRPKCHRTGCSTSARATSTALRDAAVRAGGSVVKAPSDMQGAGRYAVLKDPQGAVFAIIDPENARPEAAGVPPLGTFSWHELATSDNEAAFAFYSGLFGWDAMQRMDMGPTGVYLIFGQNGVQRGGMYIKPAEHAGAAELDAVRACAQRRQGFRARDVGGRQANWWRPWTCRVAAESPP